MATKTMAKYTPNREFYIDAAGSRYWVRKAGNQWKITADGSHIYGLASWERCDQELRAMFGANL